MSDFDEIKKLLSQGKLKDEYIIGLIDELARSNPKNFLEFFHKDLVPKIDWNQPVEYMDESVKHYATQPQLKKKSSLFLVLKATNPKGRVFRTLINVDMLQKQGQFRVGTAALPLEDPIPVEETKQNLSEEELMELAMKNIAERGAEGLQAPANNSPNCSRCGRSDLQLTITLEAVTLKTEQLCPICMGKGGPNNNPIPTKTLAEIDAEIAEFEDLATTLEEIIKKAPNFEENVPPELSRYVMTPQGNYRTVQAMLADLRSQRMVALTHMDSAIRLEYELKKATEAEDFERAAQLRDQLNALRDK
jgi:UvrB/uvrC motif